MLVLEYSLGVISKEIFEEQVVIYLYKKLTLIPSVMLKVNSRGVRGEFFFTLIIVLIQSPI